MPPPPSTGVAMYYAYEQQLTFSQVESAIGSRVNGVQIEPAAG